MHSYERSKQIFSRKVVGKMSVVCIKP